MKTIGVPPQPSDPAEVDLSTGPSGDRDFAFIEKIASELVADIPALPRIAAAFARALMRNADANANELGRDWTSGADVFNSFIVNGLSAALGDGFYTAAPIAAVFNVDPSEITSDNLTELNDRITWSAAGFEDSYRNASLEDIVAMAGTLCDLIPGLTDHLGLGPLSPLDLENVAALVAPGMVYLAKQLASAYADFPREIVPSLSGAAAEPD